MRLATAALLLTALLAFGTPAARAVPGSLDPSFGGGGVVTTRIGDNSSAAGLALQPNGKIVAAGWSYGRAGEVFALARYSPDGTLDPAFSGNGTTTTPWSADARARAVALQPDGKIVTAGQIFYRAKFALARYGPDGSLDPSFGSSGKLTFPIGEESGASAVAVQPDGRIVVAGYASNGARADVALARLEGDGSPDRRFGTAGVTTTSIGLGSTAAALVLQPDGKIVVAGSSIGGNGKSRMTLVRYDADGSLDGGFGSGGIAALEGSPYDADAYALALQPDGKLVVAGNDSGRGFALARFLPDGTLDPGFGSGGRALTAFRGFGEATAVSIQPDGMIVAAGRALDGVVETYAVARYDPAGSLDPGFGQAGVVVTRLSPLPRIAIGTPAAVLIQGDGRIVVGGTIQVVAGIASPSFGLARYLVTAGCRVPDVRGRLLVRARALLVSAGCALGQLTRAVSSRVKRGRVISQRPAPGAGLPELARVRLVVSRGRR